MDTLTLAVTSRNYFNLPAWIALHTGLFAEEGLAVTIDHIEAIDAVNEAVTTGRAQFAYGVTEHVILDAEAGGRQVILGGNVNRLPFSLIAAPEVRSFEDLRGRTIGVSSLRAGSSSLIMRLLGARGLHYPQDYTLVACGPILARWDKLRSGEIQAGLQGVPLNYIALDQGFTSLCERRSALVPVYLPECGPRLARGESVAGAALPARLRARTRTLLRGSRDRQFYRGAREPGRVGLRRSGLGRIHRGWHLSA